MDKINTNFLNLFNDIENKPFEIVSFLKRAVDAKVSDVHLRVGSVPAIRKDGVIVRTQLAILTPGDIDQIVDQTIKAKYKPQIDDVYDFDYSYEIPHISRFRINLCHEKGEKSLVIRVIPYDVPSLKDLNLPPTIKNFTRLNNGIVLITGPTGSGKSTTIASLLDTINEKQQKHVITLEDPIEFTFTNKSCVFTQRQLGTDTLSFPDGVKYALRQDPDIILIGEMRDRETIMSALKAAETGHLVFSTLHTTDSVQTVNRIINAFEPHEREAIKNQIANTLRGTVSQKLMKKADGSGRIPAVEMLVVTPTVRNYILKDELDCIYDLVRTGSFEDMLTMNMSLYRLAKMDLITQEDAMKASDSPNEMAQLLRGAFRGSADARKSDL